MISKSTSPSDEVLAWQTQGGSVEAFEQLVLRYEKRVYAFVSQACRNSMDAAEITQETFVRAFQAIDQFDPGRAFAPWLFTIARRKCVDHFRALKSSNFLQTSASDTVAGKDGHEGLREPTNPAEILALEDDRRHLWSLARRILPQLQFESLWFHYAEDMSVAEVAKILRRPQTYIKVLLFRARRTLAERIKLFRPSIESTPPQNVHHAYEIPVR